MDETWRRLDNVSNGESMVFVETAEETGDQRLVLVVDVEPGSGPALHSHHQQETFELVSGSIQLRHERTQRLLEPGQAATVPGGDLHCFTNVGEGPAQVKVTVVPSMHFERNMRVLVGLTQEGRLGKMGQRPPEPALMAAICRVSGFYMPAMPKPVWNIMTALLAPFRQRALREAIERHDRPRPAPGERVGQLAG